LSRELDVPRVQYENLKRQSNNGNRKGYDWKMLAPRWLVHVHFYCLYRKYMKPVDELLAGVLLFFIVDRAARFVSAWVSENRRMDDMTTEKIRSGVETVIMLAVFVFLWNRLKR
jgi:hypothetical protein